VHILDAEESRGAMIAYGPSVKGGLARHQPPISGSEIVRPRLLVVGVVAKSLDRRPTVTHEFVLADACRFPRVVGVLDGRAKQPRDLNARSLLDAMALANERAHGLAELDGERHQTVPIEAAHVSTLLVRILKADLGDEGGIEVAELLVVVGDVQNRALFIDPRASDIVTGEREACPAGEQ